jgi:predicted esterase YcpF (UPF0227 family)
MIIYCHGLGSDGQAFKARLLRRFFPHWDIKAPDLPLEPMQAIVLIEVIIQKSTDPAQILLIGSSLGGFYAYHFHQTRNINAVLLNPTLNPLADLEIVKKLNYPNEQISTIRWTNDFNQQLSQLYHPPKQSSNEPGLYVYLNQDNEILDYKCAADYFEQTNASIRIFPKGGHVFLNFMDILPDVREIYKKMSSIN